MTETTTDTPPQPPSTIWTTQRLAALIVVVLVVTAAVVVWALTGGDGTDSAAASGSRIGRKAPDFALPDPYGGTTKLSDYRGQVVLVNFWATWCPPCRVEMPELEQLYQKHKDAGLVVIGVDQAESAEAVKEYVKDKFSWPFALDQTGETSGDYGVYGIPMTFLIDRDGKIVYVWDGAVTSAVVEQELAKLGIKG